MKRKSSNKEEIKAHQPEYLQTLQEDIRKLSYEDSLNSLNELINKLKSETIAIENLQEDYMKGLIYLKHCELILSKVEQNIIEMDLENI